MSAIVFGDLFKTVNDFFSKPYVSDSLQFEGKVSVPECDNMKVTPTFNKTAAGATLSGLEIEQTKRLTFPQEFVTNAKVITKSNGQVKAEVKLAKFSFLDGLGLNVIGDMNLNDCSKDKYEVSLDMKKAAGTGIVKAIKQPNQEPIIEPSVSLLINNRFLVGGMGKFEGADVKGYEAGLSVVSPDSLLAVSIDSRNTLKVGGMYNTATKCTCAAQVEIGDKAPKYSLGLQRILNGTKFNAKVDNLGLLSLAASHRIGRVTSTISTEVNVPQMFVAKTGVKFLWEE